MNPTRYALAGAGSRGYHMYARPLYEQGYHAALTAVFDPNPVRAAYVSERCGGVPAFGDFDDMIQRARPDAVIITTVDCFHARYAVRAMELGCDVVLEKPMATTAEGVGDILKAEKRTGRTVTVTFNMRYMPPVARIKALLRDGAVGQILSADLTWMLDTRHGADFFHRWHAHMEKSAGLLVHKASHHFDMMNWWLDDEPRRVCAHGALRCYGGGRAPASRCMGCPQAGTCPYHFDITASAYLRDAYLAAEAHDGYLRDTCVFSGDIDIYDTVSLTARYRGGALLTYSLNAHSPWEGWRTAINGQAGRLEYDCYGSGPLAGSDPPIRLYDRQGRETRIPAPPLEGDHGGADELLRRTLFDGAPDPVPGQSAGTRAGAVSALLGIAANESIASGRAVDMDDDLSYTGNPFYKGR